MEVLLIPGTHAWRDDGVVAWYDPRSPFSAYLMAHGIGILGGDRPYVWDTNLGGVGIGRGDLLVWKAAGLGLFNYLVPPLCPDRQIPPANTHLIVHSHALQVALFACAAGLKAQTLVSIGSPIRWDMAETARQARPNITRWIHLHGGRRDWWQWLGELGDGHLGVVRRAPLADRNVTVPGVNHSDLLYEAAYFPIVTEALIEGG